MTAPQQPDPATGQEPTEQTAETPMSDLERRLKTLENDNKNLRKRIKDELEPKAKKVDELELAGKSEVERLTAERDTLASQSSESSRLLAKLRAALKVGVESEKAEEFAARLRGESDDELIADATQLKEFLAPAKAGPRPDPSQGAAPPALNGDPLLADLKNVLGIR